MGFIKALLEGNGSFSGGLEGEDVINVSQVEEGGRMCGMAKYVGAFEIVQGKDCKDRRQSISHRETSLLSEELTLILEDVVSQDTSEENFDVCREQSREVNLVFIELVYGDGNGFADWDVCI
jgi:hypothetical protein